MRRLAFVILHLLRFLALTLFGLSWQVAHAADVLSLKDIRPDAAIGQHIEYLFGDAQAPLSLEQVREARAEGRFTQSTQFIPAFGIGSRPVWVRVAIDNPDQAVSARQLLIEIPWLDKVDAYFIQGRDITHRTMGDKLPFEAREFDTRQLAIRHDFAPGLTEVYLRIATPDPIVLPIYLPTLEESRLRERQYSYGYGFLYGYLFALLAYNLVLSISLRTRSHLLYASFIAVFLVLNFSYTCHAFALVWPNAVEFQQWIVPILMVAYANTGLAFTRNFLEMAQRDRRTYGLIGKAQWLTYTLVLAITLFSQDQRYTLLLAFAYVAAVSFVTPLLGLKALRAGMPASRYFLCATLATMLGMLSTSLCVWGVIPYTQFAFHAAELGMLIDATLLALALGYRFRTIQSEHAAAEQLAARDSLTNLYNRRAFLALTEGHWEKGRRQQRSMSLIMLDLDHFKSINDR